MVAALLALALQLLIAAQKPNVPVELRNQAISTAELAIEFATNSQQNIPQIINPIPQNTQQVFGSASQQVNTTTCIEKPTLTLTPDASIIGSIISFKGVVQC